MSATAGERLRLLLAMVPWIVANPGQTTNDVAGRFGVSEDQLIRDLEVVWMVGLPPYSPDTLVEVVLDEGRVWIKYADFFSRPLQLSPAQALALLASSDALLSMPGTEPDGPLTRALAKLGEALGVGPDEAIDVDLGAAEAGVLAHLRQAAEAGTEVDIAYYSYNRDDHTQRTIAPWRITASGGAWYVESWCHLANDERIFRVDRIESARPTGALSEKRPDGSEPSASVFHPREGDPRVSLRLQGPARWVIETYPCEEVVQNADGTIDTTLAITATPWLERLLVRLGPDATVIAAPGMPAAATMASDAAHRILGRYN